MQFILSKTTEELVVESTKILISDFTNIQMSFTEMKIDRRKALAYISILGGGAIISPGCDFSNRSILEAYEKLGATKADSKLIYSLSSLIIPTDEETKGAGDLEIQDFILLMINDATPEKKRLQFVNGMKNFNLFIESSLETKFKKLEASEQEKVLEKILNNEMEMPEIEEPGFELEDIHEFIRQMKQLTIQGFISSEYVMTELMPYELVPGPFQGKVKIVEGAKVNING